MSISLETTGTQGNSLPTLEVDDLLFYSTSRTFNLLITEIFKKQVLINIYSVYSSRQSPIKFHFQLLRQLITTNLTLTKEIAKIACEMFIALDKSHSNKSQKLFNQFSTKLKELCNSINPILGIFEDTDLVIVPSSQAWLAKNTTTPGEFSDTLMLYTKIINNQTTIKLPLSDQDPIFYNELLLNLRILLSRHSGKKLISSLASLENKQIQFCNNTANTFKTNGKYFQINLNFKSSIPLIVKMQEAKVSAYSFSFISLFHEGLHAKHAYDSFPSFKIRSATTPLDALYTNAEEELTITGSTLEHRESLCENQIRREFFLPNRCSHRIPNCFNNPKKLFLSSCHLGFDGEVSHILKTHKLPTSTIKLGIKNAIKNKNAFINNAIKNYIIKRKLNIITPTQKHPKRPAALIPIIDMNNYIHADISNYNEITRSQKKAPKKAILKKIANRKYLQPYLKKTDPTINWLVGNQCFNPS